MAYYVGRFITTEITPAQIVADQNNYSASGTVAVWRLSTDAPRTLTGIGAPQTGRELRIVNVGSFNIALANQSASSTDVNRIITGTGANIILGPDDVVNLWYDGTTARWRVGAVPDPVPDLYAPGSITIPTGQFKVMADHLELGATDVLTIEGTGCLVIV